MADYRIHHWVVSCVLVILFSSCSHTSPKPTDLESQTNQLTHSIASLSAQVLSEDAKNVSNVLILTSNHLANEYDMERPALYHNMLVNLGFRNRGLCCHWAEDLHAELRKLNTDSLNYAWLVARHGSKLREHNSIVIYAEDLSWQEGLIFDPWRTAGEPFWIAVKDDHYPWELHPLNGQWDALHCK